MEGSIYLQTYERWLLYVKFYAARKYAIVPYS